MEPLTSRNAWVLSVREARHVLSAPVTIACAAAALFLALIAAPAAHRTWAASYVPAQAPVLLSQILLYAGIFLPLYVCPLAIRIWQRWAPIRTPFTSWYGAATGLAIGSFAFLFTVLATAVSGVMQQAGPGGFGPGVLFAALVTAFQAYGEEFFFRGWLQPVLASQWGIRNALLVTAVIFAFSHWIIEPLSLLAAVNIFIAGLFFGILALRTGGLAAPFAAHWAWNWLEQSVLGMVPNPGVSAFGSVFDFDLVGSRLLGGGPDGLNGSLIVTVVLSACIAGLVLANSPTASIIEPAVPAVELAQRQKRPRHRVSTR